MKLLITWLSGGMILALACPVWGAAGGASVAMRAARGELARHQLQPALETLTAAAQDPGFARDRAAPELLMALGESAERYVQRINDRYWKRSRLDPLTPSWLAYLRGEQHWAAQHFASFSYFDPRGRYRYDGDAYRLLVRKFGQSALAEEASWRLIPCEDDGQHHVGVDPALLDASRHERFLRRFPRSRHRLGAKLAVGWDYLYASGFTWGQPDKRRFLKGERILQGIVYEAPASSEAKEALGMLRRAHDPFGTPAARPARGS